MQTRKRHEQNSPNPGRAQEATSRLIINQFLKNYDLEEAQHMLLNLLTELMGDDRLNEEPIDRSCKSPQNSAELK